VNEPHRPGFGEDSHCGARSHASSGARAAAALPAPIPQRGLADVDPLQREILEHEASLPDGARSSRGWPQPTTASSSEAELPVQHPRPLRWLIIYLIIQTIRQAPSRPDAIDEVPDVSRPDPSGTDQFDAEHQATDLAVGVRIPRGAPNTQVSGYQAREAQRSRSGSGSP
jgi:hypothetical protein